MNAIETKQLTETEAYELGFKHGAEMARESGSAQAGVDGWDGMLINADSRFVREAFGWDGIDSTEESKQLLRKYAEGCQAGADAEIAGDDSDLLNDEIDLVDLRGEFLGEYGRHGGAGPVVMVYAPAHCSDKVRKLWAKLDECDDAIEEDRIFDHLERLGAVERE